MSEKVAKRLAVIWSHVNAGDVVLDAPLARRLLNFCDDTPGVRGYHLSDRDVERLGMRCRKRRAGKVIFRLRR